MAIEALIPNYFIAVGIFSASMVEDIDEPTVGVDINGGQKDVEQDEDDGFFDLLASAWQLAWLIWIINMI